MTALQFRPLVIGGTVAAIGLATLVVAGPRHQGGAEPAVCSSCDTRHQRLSAKAGAIETVEGNARLPEPLKGLGP